MKIDNTYFEVPQFGVSDADIVFVEQVEGGLTRLIAVFHTTMPTEVGPVRSVRTTDAQLLPAFGRPALVFSGGAGGPLADLAATSIVDTSAYGNAYFRSDVATGSYNLHANLTKIKSDVKGLLPARSIGFHFATISPQAAQGKHVSSLHVVMQAGTIDFRYTGGRYVRMLDGSVVSDYQGKVEATDNVLVQHIVDRPDGNFDVIGSPSYLSQTVGSGRGVAVPRRARRSRDLEAGQGDRCVHLSRRQGQATAVQAGQDLGDACPAKRSDHRRIAPQRRNVRPAIPASPSCVSVRPAMPRKPVAGHP